jgi:hypothetical protein
MKKKLINCDIIKKGRRKEIKKVREKERKLGKKKRRKEIS